MDTLSSHRRQLSPVLVSRDRGFYDQFEYALCIRMPEISVLRSRTSASIDLELDYRQAWRGHLGGRNFGGSWRSHQRDITVDVRQNCHAFLYFIQNESGDYKIWFSQDWAYVYSNDLGFLRRVEVLPYVEAVEIRRAVIDQERDTVLVRSSPYTRRSYLRGCNFSESDGIALRNFLAQQQDIRLSPGFQEWLKNHQHTRIFENFFIDHHGRGIELMVSLISPRLIRKTVIIKHDK